MLPLLPWLTCLISLWRLWLMIPRLWPHRQMRRPGKCQLMCFNSWSRSALFSIDVNNSFICRAW